MYKVRYNPDQPLTAEQIMQLEAQYGALQRYRAGKNKGLPKIQKFDSDKLLLKWGDKQYTFKGLIDLNTLPNHIKDKFLGKRAEYAGKRFLVCGTPVYSTSNDAINEVVAWLEHLENT